MRLIRDNLPLIVAAIVAAALVTIVAFTTKSMTAVLLTGLGAGIVTGGFISLQQRPQRPKKRKR